MPDATQASKRDFQRPLAMLVYQRLGTEEKNSRVDSRAAGRAMRCATCAAHMCCATKPNKHQHDCLKHLGWGMALKQHTAPWCLHLAAGRVTNLPHHAKSTHAVRNLMHLRL
eukprot:14923423-Alexandrium_andersonii.AAC.1